jgi:hypothetical protein
MAETDDLFPGLEEAVGKPLQWSERRFPGPSDPPIQEIARRFGIAVGPEAFERVFEDSSSG